MTNNELQPRLSGATSALRIYSLAVVAAGLAVQVIIALLGNRIGLLSGVMIALIAVGYVLFLLRYGRSLRRVRFGALVTHFITYLAVNVGFSIHFLILALGGSAVTEAGGDMSAGLAALNSGWFGVVISMPALWGLGLLIHALGTVLGRGFEAGS